MFGDWADWLTPLPNDWTRSLLSALHSGCVQIVKNETFLPLLRLFLDLLNIALTSHTISISFKSPHPSLLRLSGTPKPVQLSPVPDLTNMAAREKQTLTRAEGFDGVTTAVWLQGLHLWRIASLIRDDYTFVCFFISLLSSKKPKSERPLCFAVLSLSPSWLHRKADIGWTDPDQQARTDDETKSDDSWRWFENLFSSRAVSTMQVRWHIFTDQL